MKFKLRSVDIDLKSLQQGKRRVIIDKIARKGIQIFRQEIKKRRLVNTGHLLESVAATVQKNGVKFEIGAEYAGFLNKGVRRHKMRYLVDAGPVPITTRKSRKIFRVATNKNIRQRGRWIHPGFKRGKGFFDSGVKKINNYGVEIVAKEFDQGIT